MRSVTTALTAVLLSVTTGCTGEKDPGQQPNVVEYKVYAPGIGPVLTLGVSGGVGREELVRMDRALSSAGTGPLGSPAPDRVRGGQRTSTRSTTKIRVSPGLITPPAPRSPYPR